MKSKSLLFLLAAITLLSCSGAKKEQAPEPKKNIGLQLYSLRDCIGGENDGIDSIITAVGEIGYKYVEAASYWDGDGSIYGLQPADFKAKCEAAGIEPLSCHIMGPGDLSEAPETIWAWWDKAIAVHKAAGMKYIVKPSMPQPKTVEELQQWCDYYNQVGEKCNAAGLKFGYHNHSAEFTTILANGADSISWYDYMVQHTDPAKVFFQLDVYWCQKGGRLATEAFKQYPGRFELLHIKDEKELGASGYMDFKPIYDAVGEAGTKYMIVEVERYDFPPVESVRKSFEYLNSADFVKADYSK
jgi:sugar phosphate isomerase/epimerase